MTPAERMQHHIKRATAHLENFEWQLRSIPEDADPEELGLFADRIKKAHDEVLHAMAYARVSRARKAEAEARVDAVLQAVRRAA